MSGFEAGDGKRIAALLYASDDPPAERRRVWVRPSGYDGPEDGVIVEAETHGYPGTGWLCPNCYTASRMEIVVLATGPDFEGQGCPGIGAQCLTCPLLYGEVLECS